MPSSPPSPILVTGAHRSGTTWVGKMLAASPQVAYISEPLNVLHRPGVMRAPVDHWYIYITDENEDRYLPALRRTLAFRYGILDEIASLRSRKDIMRMGRDLSIFFSGRLQNKRPLLKDPFSLFSAPWFAERLGCQVVITVRHPAAFASSLKRLNWPFDFSDLLEQPLLMRDYLEPFRQEMLAMRNAPDDVIGQSCLLWRMLYQVVAWFQERWSAQAGHRPIIVRHEDLSLDPLDGYARLYESLGMEFTPQVQAAIQHSSSSENPAELSKRQVHAVQLDSRANLRNWQHRLEPAEIERIRRLTADVAGRYYTPADWQ